MSESFVTITEGKRFLRMSAPTDHDGKKLRFQEIFRSAYHEPVLREAKKNLNSIRENHDASHGWHEIDAWIEHYPDGYVACRYHAKYE